eukprot:scaffold1199_cov265-Pinguiococcus_pyrenoidosus.AAC.25
MARLRHFAKLQCLSGSGSMRMLRSGTHLFLLFLHFLAHFDLLLHHLALRGALLAICDQLRARELAVRGVEPPQLDAAAHPRPPRSQRRHLQS